MPAPICPVPITPTTLMWSSVMVLAPLHQHRQRLAAADAEARDAAPAPACLQRVQERRENARARRSDRMAERHGPAVDVHPRRVQTQLALDGQGHGGEGL